MNELDLARLLAGGSYNEAGCYEWQKEKVKGGYGRIRFTSGKRSMVHRAMYEAQHGDIPDGMVVMHICDNPACYEVSHLRLGTQKDNIRDMLNKGRGFGIGKRGEKHNLSKLTDAQVAEIRALYKGKQHAARVKTGPTTSELAALFGVSREQIGNIIRGSSRT